MNIKEELACKHCNKIYTNPIFLFFCGESICNQHIIINSSNKFTCPFCNEENADGHFKANKLIEELISRKLHQFKINQNNERVFSSLKTEIQNLETILKDPENYIYEEINELKRQVDLDRENLKYQIDTLAGGLIQQLETYGKRFRNDYNSNKDLACYNDLVESSKKELAEYETYLRLFSAENKKINVDSEKLVEKLKLTISELKDVLFSNVSIKHKKTDIAAESMFGKLIIQVRFI
jgi:hypothetical protein